MKNILKLITVITLVTLLVTQTNVISNFFTPKQAYAVGDLSVNWGVPEGQPIFVVNNMAPGQSESRTVTVTNDASSTRPVGVRGLNLIQTKSLATVLDFKITQGGVDRYGGTLGSKTLAQFMTESATPDGIFLSNLASGATTSYVFTVTFQSSAGNEFQDASAEFDLQIGVSIDVPAACSGITFTSASPIMGTQRSDKINGTAGNDLIFALEGSDKVDGKGGNDCIVGGSGSDSLLGGIGNDTILGGEGSDDLDGGNGIDKLFGEAGSDSMSGGPDSDTLNGGAGSDSAKGDGGTDTCIAESKKNCEL